MRHWFWAHYYADGEGVLTASSIPEAGRELLASGRICAEAVLFVCVLMLLAVLSPALLICALVFDVNVACLCILITKAVVKGLTWESLRNASQCSMRCFREGACRGS